MTVRLNVNGEAVERAAPCSLLELVRDLAAGSPRLATVVNGNVVPAARRADYILQDGDRVELFTFAGGG